MFFDPMYLVMVLLPGLLISGLASWLVRSAFAKYSRVPSQHGITGAQAAQRLLDRAGIRDVRIVRAHGQLSDHYNPTTKELALSPDVYGSTSVAAIGVAAHEAGHAIQHATNYAALHMRSALVPLAGIGSSMGYIVMAMGLFFNKYLVLAGAIMFAAVLLFQLKTLPVEFDATARAKRLVVEAGIISPQERHGMDKVLNAAAVTYVAAVVTTLMTLLYFLMRAGLLGGNSE